MFAVVLEYCVGSSDPQTYQEMVAEVDHELGHLWNNNHPFTTPLKTGGKTVFPDATTTALSGPNSFDFFVQHDFFNLDWFDQAGTMRRPPCGANGGTGPFSPYADLQHGNVNICNGNTPNPPYDGSTAVTNPSDPSGPKIKLTTNGLILQYTLPYYFVKVTNSESVLAWDELYPEEFGQVEVSFTGGDLATSWDQLIISYFTCSKATWPSIAVQGGTLPPGNQSQSCEFTIPAKAHVYQ